jgi:elongation factor P
MLAYTELTKGILFVYEGDPYEVVEANFVRMQQRKAVVQTRIRNLVTGKMLDRTWQASDSFEEAEVERKNAVFLYASRGEFWFHVKGDPKSRFALTAEVIGDQAKFLKPNMELETFVFNDKVIKVKIPIKMEFKVIEAPPGTKGNTAQGGNKTVTIEGGAKVNVPLFVEQDEIIRINTETGEYVERVQK